MTLETTLNLLATLPGKPSWDDDIAALYSLHLADWHPETRRLAVVDATLTCTLRPTLSELRELALKRLSPLPSPAALREELDQVFVCRAQQVGKFEILVAQRNFFKVLHEVDQRVVVERTLADLAVEVDVFQHVLQRIDVGIFNRFQRLVQRATNVFFQVADGVPVRILRHEKGVVVSVGKLLGNGRIRHTLGLEIARELVSLLIEQIAQALQEQHAEDVFLVLGGIHVAAQIVTGAGQQAGKLA